MRFKYCGQYIVSLFVVIFFGGVTVSLLYLNKDLSTTIKDVLLVLVGVLASAFKDVVGYWIGSSHSSQVKQEELNGIARSSKDLSAGKSVSD